jgi:hypothetical protein
MTRILLVGTVHEENGLATTSALLGVLESVRPEVIFLEIPTASFPGFDEGTSSNLESRAARRYREATGAELIPVDIPTPEESFFRDWRYMDRRITITSPSYRQLIDQNTIDVATHGFSYLNSVRCRDAWSAIYDAMEVAIQRLSHDTKLPMIYETWRRVNGLRDGAMLQGINAHLCLKPFTTGVLLVGAAHAHSIANRSRKGCHADAPRIDYWDPM